MSSRVHCILFETLADIGVFRFFGFARQLGECVYGGTVSATLGDDDMGLLAHLHGLMSF